MLLTPARYFMETLIGRMEDFTILDGEDTSNSIKAKGAYDGTLLVYGHTVTDGALTYKYQVSPDDTEWYDLVDAADNPVTPPIEGEAKSLTDIAAFTRIKASAAVTGDKLWRVSGEL